MPFLPEGGSIRGCGGDGWSFRASHPEFGLWFHYFFLPSWVDPKIMKFFFSLTAALGSECDYFSRLDLSQDSG